MSEQLDSRNDGPGTRRRARAVRLFSALMCAGLAIGLGLWLLSEPSGDSDRALMRRLAPPTHPAPGLPLERLQADPGAAPIRSATPMVLPSKPVVLPSFHGRVTDSRSGAPIADAVVHLVETRDEVRSDGLGRFVLPALQPGARTVHVMKAGYQAEQRRLTPQYGLGPMGLDFRLEAVETGRIEGRVSFRGAVPDAFTVFLDLRAHTFHDPAGRFTIAPVNVGRRKIGYGIPQGEGAKPLPLNFTMIEIHPDETTTVELEAPPLGRIAGLVVGPDGAPIRGGFLRFHPLYVPIGLDGTFDSPLIVAGKHPVRLIHPDYGQPMLGRLELAEGEERTNLRYTVRPVGRGSITLTVSRTELPRGFFARKPQVMLWDMSRAHEKGAESHALLTGDRRSLVFDPRTGHRFPNVGVGPHRVAIYGAGGVLQRDLVIGDGEALTIELGAADLLNPDSESKSSAESGESSEGGD